MRAAWLLFGVVALVGSCQCATDPCAQVRCADRLVCDPETARCALPAQFLDAGDGDAGPVGDAGADAGTDAGVDAGRCGTCPTRAPYCDADAGVCRTCTDAVGCGGATPICNVLANGGEGRCQVCTPTRGCSGLAPYCDVGAPPAGQCVECQGDNDCAARGKVCDLWSQTCVDDDGGFAGVVTFGDGGQTTPCNVPRPATPSCTTECPNGFTCVAGRCELRGRSGQLQVTLRFSPDEDIDLYVVEPLPDGGSCEIFYGQPNVDAGIPFPLPIPLPPMSCGSLGWLDLDSNRACNIDGVRVENVIYPGGAQPTRGRYSVRVNYFQSCSAPNSVPWEIEVRAFGETRFYCGTFAGGSAVGGGLGAGRFVTSFRVR